jgi:hypothetical protein
MAKERVVITWHMPSETKDEAIAFAIEMGRYNPDIHDLIIVTLHTPANREAQREQRNWTSEDLPGVSRKTDAEAIMEEVERTVPRFEGTFPDEPKEPKPERREPIEYPPLSIV